MFESTQSRKDGRANIAPQPGNFDPGFVILYLRIPTSPTTTEIAVTDLNRCPDRHIKYHDT